MGENTVNFSARWVTKLAENPPPTRQEFRDLVTPGLRLRAGPGGLVWNYLRRIDGQLVRLSLGRWPEMGLRQARAAVAESEDGRGAGRHPKAEQARRRAAVAEARQLDLRRIVSAAATAWAAHHFPTVGESSRRDYQRELVRFVDRFGDRDLSSITRGEVIRHLDTLRGASANRAAVVVRQLFTFARDRYDLESNPVADLGNPVRQAARKRTLTRDEIRVLWRACELAGWPYGHALRFALCTAQRIGEIGALRRDDIDDQWWVQTRNKSDRRIDIYLATVARAILDDCPAFGPEYPFYFSASGGRTGLRSDGWHLALKRHIAPRIPIAAAELNLPAIDKQWTAHDLRRTVRTGLTGWCRVSPDTAERVLNHALSGLRAVYDHADYSPHIEDALTRWDSELARILAGEASGIVSLSGRTARKRRAG